jgi:hypothetical protein
MDGSMNVSTNRNSGKFRTLILVCLSLFWLSACTASPPEPPISIPFTIHKKGSILESEFVIKEDAKYEFNLFFRYKENNQADYLKVRQFIGEAKLGGDGNPIVPGILTPLELKVIQLDDPLTGGEHIVLDKSGQVFKWTSTKHGGFIKEITRVSLIPGHYRATIISKTDIPVLEGTVVEFEIRRFFRK